jgi:hypothetical protein
MRTSAQVVEATEVEDTRYEEADVDEGTARRTP